MELREIGERKRNFLHSYYKPVPAFSAHTGVSGFRAIVMPFYLGITYLRSSNITRLLARLSALQAESYNCIFLAID